MSFPNLSALAVRERAVTLFFLILAVIGGVYAFLSLGRAEDPSFTVRLMMVSAGLARRDAAGTARTGGGPAGKAHPGG
jgi:multidrug efflux pump subunit AcrB